MYRFFYSLIFYLLLPVIYFRLWLRGKQNVGYRQRWGERLGFHLPACSNPKIIWVHSVSVGETLAAIPLCRCLNQKYPDHQLLITTTTPTGSERVHAAFGDSVIHCYLPYDITPAIRRFLKHFQPALLIIMETELWPNLIAHCKMSHIPMLLANARLSDKSTKGYLKFAKLTRPMVQALDKIATQSRDDANNFLKLGANLQQISVSGNVKYDLQIEEELLDNSLFLREKIFGQDCKVWIAASTHKGEDEKILAIHQRVLEHCPNAKLIIVPRHPERFDRVAELCLSTYVPFIRRSQLQQANAKAGILLGDSMGEMMMYYAMADCAFVGGSLVETGGHNLLEPAALGLPSIVGLHTFNFKEATQTLIEEGATIQTDEGEMPQAICYWLTDESARKTAGQKGKELIEKNRGALHKLMQYIDPLLNRTFVK
ncbi:MAG: 3-deoxy-D-manno-octulosonic acid transferase [Gammaproteobacteria bacterium CG22_combo_CG10-13_8_21_14_all_40_8]|nr:MAG: 3-deoxy-D-manno-octulosonic acid transferase [Gammaproteobacteria bacterium CG22_combo_CG10-13_8_21_14_all_40_8]